MVIVGSSVWIDYLHNTVTPQTDWLEYRMDSEPIGLTALVLCEVLQGIRHERGFREAERQLLSFPVFDTVGKGLAIAAAQNYRILQRRCITIRKTIDCVIATFCIQEGHRLLHRDRDFDFFERHLGLTVVQSSRGSLS
jgi:predicted nucleic acid-binding protein